MNLLEDTDSLGKMDPYISFLCGVNIKSTSVKKDGGNLVEWDEVIEFPRTNEDTIKVIIYDKETFRGSELVALGCLAIHPIVIVRNKQDLKISLTKVDKTLGVLIVNIEFIAN